MDKWIRFVNFVGMKSFKSKIFTLIALIAVLSGAGGCVKNEFSIQFDFPKDFFGNYIVTYYAWDSHKGAWLETTASLQEGKAEVQCVTRRPTLVFIRDASSASSVVLYVERGDRLIVTGSSADMNTWTITGNDLSEQWSKWRNSLNGKDRAKAVEEFVLKNPDSKLSAIMMLTEWDRHADPDGFIRLWNGIDKDVRGPETVEMCGAPDFPGVEFTVTSDGDLRRAKDSKMTSIVVRSKDNGVDTLNLAKTKATILFFYGDNNSERISAIDTIKVLAKEYPDSSRRIIADISAQSDSMSWISTIRRDSLKGAVRGWMPHGLADHNMIRLGIGRLPWVVVTGRKARAVYEGSDIGKAAEAFRKTMSAKDSGKSTDRKGQNATAKNDTKTN